ncbi:Ssu processome component [Lasiodiplodia theobromae]|uniref:Ssu processome component n=1 Tax=Lasiodiplodia theobromae TaxID=45133 RepID=UPI0015C3184C|nr:Ssu processome component [Lasiodiplodia theobromae]KAF4545397.1 Ssu processome component [Lasiodiplodia theobromae]
MTSALQQQLAQIAATSTHQLDLKAQKASHGKSLLFEPRIAASQDFNTIYQICHEGYQDLCMLDPRFAAFAQNLFSEQSKTEDRTQMTKKENEELDVVLESFLGLVGARILLKPAVKAVEWLVRRFRIHEYNTEFTILTFLPYHSTPVFLSLLSILPKKFSPTYRFLFPYITSLASPPRQTIVYTATHTPAFLSALNSYVLKVTKAHQQSPALISFWASVATQAVHGMLDEAKAGRGNVQRQREEDVILRILPVLNEALTLKNAPELKVGCYMIMTVMATKASFEDKLLNGMMEAVTSILAQERRSAKLPKPVLRSLLKLDQLAARISDLSQRCRVDRLAFGCVLGILEKYGKSASSDSSAWLDVVEKTLHAQIYDDLQTGVIIKSLLVTVQRIDLATDVTSEQRNLLADLIIRLNQSPDIGQTIAKVIDGEGMDVEKLEMQLKTVLRPALEPKKDEDDDVDMEDSQPALADAIEDILSTLPSETTEESFLVSHDSATFEALSKAFVPLFSGNDSRYLTFLARFWCGSYPALARSTAALIPYVKGTKAAVWGRETIYGSSSKSIKWLSTDDAAKVLTAAVLPTLEDAHKHAGASAHGPEFKSALRTSLCGFLSSHAVNTPLLGIRLQGLHLLQRIIEGKFGTDRANIQQAAFERLRAIWSSLKGSMKREAAQFLLGLALDSSDDALVKTRRDNALETLRTVELPTDVLVAFLDDIPNAAEMARFDPRDTEETTKALEKLTLVLELVEGSSPENHPALLRGLFHILGELQQYKVQTSSSLVYLQSLIISSLLAIVDRMKATGAEIDQSTIPLLLISSLATCVPDVVLHSVMPIFTFMGSSILRQTDDYSAHVVDQTVSRVVPPLAASLRKRKRDLVLGAADLLLSFTAAYEHIPLHRRLGLFGQLTKKLGPDDSLFAILAMLLEKYPEDAAVRRFATELMRMFDPVTNLKASTRYLELVQDALKPKRTMSEVLFSLSEKDADQIQETAVTLLEALSSLLQDGHLHSRLLEKTIQMSQHLLRLLPTAELVKSTDTLLGHASDDVRRTALRAVEAQAINVKQGDAPARIALLDLKHTAVACIDQISEKFDRLRDDFIPLIPKVLPKAFAYLEESINAGAKGDSLHNAVYSLLSSIIERIPYIFSGSYLDSALQLSHKSAAAELSDEADENRKQFCHLAARQIDAKDCFTALDRNWDSAVNAGFPAPKEHLSMLHTALETRPKSVVGKSAQTLFSFFLKAFDLRRTQLQSTSDDAEESETLSEINELEEQINAVALTMVMKLNDASFRPFFVRLVEWAASALPKKEARGRTLRATSLFVFLGAFFDKLRSIVTSYSSYVLELAAEVLGREEVKGAEDAALLRAVLGALTKSFENDEDDFWTAPSHFTTISTPLLTQLSTSASSPLLHSHAIPALTALAAAASHAADHHKALNTRILQLMRADQAPTRLAAVRAQQALTDALGEEWLALLPEMLPFISELQEDDDEEVERETLRWIRRIEEILGESLEGMLQ